MNAKRDHDNLQGYEGEVQRRSPLAIPDGAVFYSGRSPFYDEDNRRRAQAYVKAQPSGLAATLDDTPLGQYLDSQKLDPAVGNSSPLSREQAKEIYRGAAERFAAEARGRATCFVDGAQPDSVFRETEMPALINNGRVSHINGMPREQLQRTYTEAPDFAWSCLESTSRKLPSARELSSPKAVVAQKPVQRPLSREAAGQAPERSNDLQRERSR